MKHASSVSEDGEGTLVLLDEEGPGKRRTTGIQSLQQQKSTYSPGSLWRMLLSGSCLTETMKKTTGCFLLISKQF